MIHLPLKLNDGSPVPDALFAEARDELIAKFGGLTASPPSAPAEGWWKSGNILYRDEMVIYRVTTGQDEDEFFKQYGDILALRFKQEKIWIQRAEVRSL